MNVRVLLFAGLSDLFKKSEMELSLPEDSTLKDLRNELFKGVEKKEKRWQFLLYAVNQTYKEIDTKLRDGDEVAFLPMVSGG